MSKILHTFRENNINRFIDDLTSNETISDGTVTVSNNSVFVTGANTDFVNFLRSGDTVRLSSQDEYKEVANVVNSTSFSVNNAFDLDLANEPLYRVDEEGSRFYLFASNPNSWDDDNNPPKENDSVFNYVIDANKNMLFAKRISEADIVFLAKRNEWQANTVYDRYDHRDSDLKNKNFFVLTNDNRVYKCLNNNDGAESVNKPTSTAATSFETADGYVWKYLFTVTQAQLNKFSTNDYIPIVANSSVTSAAVNGAIEVIDVDDGGSGYITFTSGSVQVATTETTQTFKIDANASNDNDFYNLSSIYFTAGPAATIGKILKISDYTVNSSGKFVTTESSVEISPSTEYVISPTVNIEGDGSDALARSIVNANTNTIEQIELINIGKDYSRASVTISANTTYGSGAEATPIISPKGGHGAHLEEELYSERMGVGVEFNTDESDTISTDVEFRRVGIIEDPLQYDSSEPMSSTTFKQTVDLDYNSLNGRSYEQGELIIGSSSESRATVAFANSTHIQATALEGEFIQNETVIGQNTFASGTITNINNPEAEYFTGDVIYYNNFSPIERSDTTTETIKLIIKF